MSSQEEDADLEALLLERARADFWKAAATAPTEEHAALAEGIADHYGVTTAEVLAPPTIDEVVIRESEPRQPPARPYVRNPNVHPNWQIHDPPKRFSIGRVLWVVVPFALIGWFAWVSIRNGFLESEREGAVAAEVAAFRDFLATADDKTRARWGEYADRATLGYETEKVIDSFASPANERLETARRTVEAARRDREIALCATALPAERCNELFAALACTDDLVTCAEGRELLEDYCEW